MSVNGKDGVRGIRNGVYMQRASAYASESEQTNPVDRLANVISVEAPSSLPNDSSPEPPRALVRIHDP